MRVVSDEPNELKVRCNLSGTDLTLLYDDPDATMRAKYSSGMTKRKGRKMENNLGPNRQKWGKEIFRGFGEGEFGEKQPGQKKPVPVSSNPESEYYKKDWKPWFCKHHSDLIELLAIHVFDRPAEVDPMDDMTAEDDHDDDDEKEETVDPN